MTMLLRLPAKVAGLAVGAARIALQLAGSAAQAAVERVRGGRDGDRHDEDAAPARAAAGVADPPPPAPAPAPPPPVADLPDPPPLTVVPEPTPGQAARIRAEQREAEQTEDSPGAQIRVGEPWPGYRAMNAPEIIDRLRGADDAVKGVVLLYERGHRNRKTVVQAAGG
jgi:hypothetical protein